MDRKSEEAKMNSKNEGTRWTSMTIPIVKISFPVATRYETPTVTAAHKEPTGMRPKFFEESSIKQKREIERLQELLAGRTQQLNEQGKLIDKIKAPFEPAPVTDPTLTPRVPRPQDITYVETMRRQKAQEEALQTMQNPQANEETASKDLLKVLSHLATIVIDNRTASDVSEALQSGVLIGRSSIATCLHSSIPVYIVAYNPYLA
jgi:hypothetical protein